MLIGFTSATQLPRRGDFGATVEGGELLMPLVIKARLREGQIHTAEDLMSFLQAFSATLAADLGWELADVQMARRGLLKLLRGHLADEFFDEEPSFKPHYGVSPGGSR